MRSDFGGGVAPGGHTPAGFGSKGAPGGLGGGPKCPRCGRSVYKAEEVVGAGHVSNSSLLYLLCQQESSD